LRKQGIEKLLRSNGKEDEEEGQAVSASQKDNDNEKLTTLTTFDVNAGIINLILIIITSHTNNDNSEATRSVRKGIKKKDTDS